MKAFRVMVPKLSDTSFSIHMGETASKVRYLVLLDLRDPYPEAKFQDIHVIRAPEYDALANSSNLMHNSDSCLGWKETCPKCGKTEQSYGILSEK